MNSFLADAGRQLLNILPGIPAVLWAISFHEFCHGYAAYLCGDPTAKEEGRLTLNPFAHFDALGAVCLLLFHFGWAKPVPIDPRYFKKPRRDLILVSVAGICGNVLSATVVGLLIRLMPGTILSNYGLAQVALYFVLINLSFAAFNLIPIPPLDGSKILYPFLPRSLMQYTFKLERWGFVILLALIYLGAVGAIISPVVTALFRLILGPLALI